MTAREHHIAILVQGYAKASALACAQPCLYLDTNWWSRLRSLARAQRPNPELAALAAKLEDAVRSGRLRAVTSVNTPWELLNHADPDARRETARLIDRLSGGVLVADVDRRLALDVEAWILAALAPSTAYDPDWVRRQRWTIPGFALGDERLRQTAGALALRQQLTVEDVMELFGQAPTDVGQPQWTHYAVAAIGENCDADGLSWQMQAVKETLGGFDAFRKSDQLARAYRRAARSAKDAGVVLAPISEQVLDDLRGRLLQDLCDDALGQSLPTWQIRGQLHALLRADPRRRTKANDLMDHEHADAALSTCAGFLTDRGNAALLRRAKLDIRMGCRIVGRVEEAITLVNDLTESTLCQLQE